MQLLLKFTDLLVKKFKPPNFSYNQPLKIISIKSKKKSKKLHYRLVEDQIIVNISDHTNKDPN